MKKRELENILFVGQQMSNLCFNVAQSDKVPEDVRDSMRKLWQEWDEVYPRKRTIADLRQAGESKQGKE